MKILTTLAACGGIALFASAAQAQVSLYGVMDLGLAKVSRGAQQITNNGTSRLGFRGREDMGGGLEASFQLESEVKADIGMPDSTFWGRQAWVGLRAPGFGLLRLGRTKDLHDGLADEIDPFGTDGVVGEHTKDVWRVGVVKSRVSNALSYSAPTLAGLKLAAQVALHENAPGGHHGSAFSAVYEGKGFTLVAAANRPVISAAKTPQPSAWGLGGSVKIGEVKLSASHSRGDTKSSKNGRMEGTLVGAEWTRGLNTAKLVYGALDSSIKGDVKEVVGIGFDHRLSKRTHLYAMLSREQVTQESGWQFGLTHRF